MVSHCSGFSSTVSSHASPLDTWRLLKVESTKSRSHVTDHVMCYCLSKQRNCSPGGVGGQTSWLLKCTKGTSSEMRHIVLYPLPHLVTAPVTRNGIVSPTTPALSMTRASVLAPVVFLQLSLPIHHYHPLSPSLCTLGQQVTTYWLGYCLVQSRVLIV